MCQDLNSHMEFSFYSYIYGIQIVYMIGLKTINIDMQTEKSVQVISLLASVQRSK